MPTIFINLELILRSCLCSKLKLKNYVPWFAARVDPRLGIREKGDDALRKRLLREGRVTAGALVGRWRLRAREARVQRATGLRHRRVCEWRPVPRWHPQARRHSLACGTKASGGWGSTVIAGSVDAARNALFSLCLWFAPVDATRTARRRGTWLLRVSSPTAMCVSLRCFN